MTASLLGRPLAFERGDRVYITTPLTLARPSEDQIEEYAFASAVKKMAPNGHIGWLEGRYVESGKANLNKAMWLNDELQLKSLTPMLMPVTVMHDPRTAVGTIADCRLIDDERARIDTILAVWKHRFPDIWEEAEANIKDGTMMQSMECFSPAYSCSDCGQAFVKLNEGKERASWCAHLSSGESSRILQDVCFTGTGLIFGTRGGQGAYTEAHLDHFHDEIAEFHEKAHIDGSYKPRSKPKMGLVQIDEQELASLRSERDAARDEAAQVRRDETAKVEKAEADATKERERAEAAEAKAKELQEKSQASDLQVKRWEALGDGFKAKLGETTKTNLHTAAAQLSDEDWGVRLTEIEELTSVKRDTAADGSASESASAQGEPPAFGSEEFARFQEQKLTANQTPPGATNAARSLARAMRPQRPKAGATQ